MIKIGGSFDLDVYQNKPFPKFLLTRQVILSRIFRLGMIFRAGMSFKLQRIGTKIRMIFWYPDVKTLKIFHETML